MYRKKKIFHTHTIHLSEELSYNLKIGASVSNNGCCLSVTKINGNYISFDLIKETLNVTTFSELQVGDKINIERAIKFGDEIGGHLMSGHIMTVAKICKIIYSENNCEMWFQLNNMTCMKYIMMRGFIGIDGISLTVSNIAQNKFCVQLIPETLHVTTLGQKLLDHRVNIEIDYQTQVIVDTIERFLLKTKSYYFKK